MYSEVDIYEKDYQAKMKRENCSDQTMDVTQLVTVINGEKIEELFNLRNYLNDMDISKTVLELAELNEGFEVVQNELLRKNINPEEKIKPIDNLEYLAKNYNENDLEKYGDGIPVAKEIEKYCKYIHSLVKDANDINFKFNDKGELNHV